eukprot:10694146-Alexandrium_andersonii.AAC.1
MSSSMLAPTDRTSAIQIAWCCCVCPANPFRCPTWLQSAHAGPFTLTFNGGGPEAGDTHGKGVSHHG